MSGLLLCGCLLVTPARAQDVPTAEPEEAPVDEDEELVFDAELLRQRGLDPKLGEYLSRGARFTPGRQTVTLIVNNQRIGEAGVSFDQEGKLCMDEALLERAGLKIPKATAPDGALACDDFRKAYPATVIDKDPAMRTVTLLVPGDARQPGREGVGGFVEGGVGGLFNYSVMTTRSDGSNGASTYVAAITEAGFNAGDWIFRSRQSYTRSEEKTTLDITQSYAQRTFTRWKTVLQLGELDMLTPVLPGTSITGIQVLPEAALQVGDGPVITGIANSNARVEVRQRDVLLYVTVVEAGRFTLSGLPALSALTDVDVKVIEADGSEHGFTVPAVALAGLVRPKSGYTFAVGEVRNVELAPGRQGWVASASWSGALGGWGIGSLAAMAAQDYTALGGSGFVGWRHGTSLSPYVLLSHAKDADGTRRGWHAGLGLQQTLGSQLSVNAGVATQSRDYRELVDVLSATTDDATRARYREQAHLSLSWSTAWLGSITAGYSRAIVFYGRPTSRASLSWGRNFRWATVSLNAERDLAQRDVPDSRNDTVEGDAYRVYLSVSVPLGERRRARTNVQHDRSGERIGVSYTDAPSTTLSYRLGVDHDSWTGRTDTSASAAWLPRYLQTSVSYTRSSLGNSSSSVLLGGGVAMHGRGVTLSPYPIQDTFGIVALSDRIAGVEISTPYGPVWTDPWGKAVVAQLTPYATSMVEVETGSLPRNMLLDNGVMTLEAGRGAVAQLDLATRFSRRIQLLPMHPDGSPLPRGTTAFRTNDDLVGMVTAAGSLFVYDAVDGETLELHLPDERVCTLRYPLDEQEDENVTMPVATVTCRPGAAEAAP
ncbi:fimbria/pilus outer membrane usher protein [uncultured Stenotrophomonas sp.]|uniref:fimbria/pilus outer membrane usher protein n=1 Tax=uncultured Stenotrophomonas sp. TaxID=165438 RepID=UPI0028F02667|nr:fimbria/pilus outer membrane usher protein [uncultured Stenotrophomonas sp.]